MNIINNCKLITCITPKGKGLGIVRELKEEKGVITGNVAGGRGGGRRGRIEVDIITVVVEGDRADEIFEFIYDKADIQSFHGGFLFQGKLAKSTRFVLPDVPAEKGE